MSQVLNSHTTLSLFSSPNHELPESVTIQELLDLGINARLTGPDGANVLRVATCLKHPAVPYLMTIYFSQLDQNGRERVAHEIKLDETINVCVLVMSANNELLTQMQPYPMRPEEHPAFVQQVELMYYALPGITVTRPYGLFANAPSQ